MNENNRQIAEGEPTKRYRLSYDGKSLGSYDSATATLESYESYETIRPIVDRKNQGRYKIRDGKRVLTIRELREAAAREGGAFAPPVRPQG
jgi:hypothetical protein